MPINQTALNAETDALLRDPEFALAVMYRLIDKMPKAQFKAAVISPDADGDDALHCPECGVDFNEVVPVVVDLSTRWSYVAAPGAFDFAAKTMDVDYGSASDSDFQTLHYRCDNCGVAISLPEGWKEI